jgi:uncharacterized protein YecE (DUF72 family)
MPETRIGISGWRYTPWRGRFYPQGLPQNKELFFASRMVNSIEINGSFYSLQRPSSYQQWYKETPEDFVFSLKGGRFITHMRRLRDIEIPLANYFASGVLCLKEKLGPILWQFPPNFKFDPERFESFFELLPHDTKKASKLASKHELKKGRSWTKPDAKRRVRHAIEIRHESFLVPEFFKLLRKYNIAFVIADTAKRFPFVEDVTSDFVYARLHGEQELYVSGYTDESLTRWAQRFEAWRNGEEPEDAKRVASEAKKLKRGRDVYCYFDNDVKVYAPRDARDLAKRLGVEMPDLNVELLTRGKRGSRQSPIEKPRTGFPGMNRIKRRGR